MVTLKNAAIIALVVGSMASLVSGSSAAAPKPSTGAPKKQTAPAKPAVAPKETPSTTDELSYNGPPVLNPESVYGTAAFGYAAAKAAPGVMAKLFCYCGCDLSDNHTYLIDCFTSNHGMDCHICQEEAMMGLKMHREGKPMAEIQKAIDEKYSKQYPFEQPTETYKKYKSAKLYKDFAGPEPDTSSSTTASEPKLKPGMSAGSCCSGHDDDKKK